MLQHLLPRKRLRTAILLLTMLLLLSACSERESSMQSAPIHSDEQQTDTAQSETPSSSEPTDSQILPTEDPHIGWIGVGGYYTLSKPDIQNAIRYSILYEDSIYTNSLHFTDHTVLHELHRDGELFYTASSDLYFTVGKSGIWVVRDVTDYSKSSRRKLHLIQLDKNGEELFSQDISKQIADSYITGMLTDSSGNIVLLLEKKVLVFDEAGTLIGEILLEQPSVSLVSGKNNQLVAVLSDGAPNKRLVMLLDTESMTAKLIDKYEDFQVYDGGEEYLFTLLNDNGLYGIPSVQESMVPVAIWNELLLDYDSPIAINWLKNGSFLLQSRKPPVILSPEDPMLYVEKKILTMATASQYSSLYSIVEDFNMNSDKYRIKIVNYTQDGTLSEQEAISALNKDLLEGEIPDLLDLTYLSQTYYTEKGLLEDLTDYFEKDPDIQLDDFILFDRLAAEDGLFQVASLYHLETAAVPKSLSQDSADITPEKYLALQKDKSLFRCYVDSVSSLAEAEAIAGESLNFVGILTPDNTVSTTLIPRNLIGICKQGQSDESWEFVKYVLTQDEEDIAGFGISSNKNVLEKQMEKALDASIKKKYAFPFERKHVDQFYELLESASYYEQTDTSSQ